ncbi:MAG TPA: DUF4430 domain-containing protein [Thermoleophilaceae bacterium]|jgi:hypothetical protein
MRVAAALLALATLALALAGCGFGPGKKLPGGAQLEVTRNFGQAQLYSTSISSIRKDETVMRLLESKRQVKTSYGGKFVDSIDGLATKGAGGRSDWFYYVNGIEASVGAADRTLSPGDVVQWDYRPWDATPHIPAIVGAYPEPFVRGTGGKRLPVRIECSAPNSDACKTVDQRLSSEGAVTSSGVVGGSAGPKTLRVVVAPWTALDSLGGAIGSLTRGPGASGVFARFARDGNSLQLLDQFGHTARVAPPGTGLVAATAAEGSQPVWVVTGLGEAAVDRAAQSLDVATLHNAFAVAITPEGKVRLPVVSR